jgi:hypothetical protein
MATVYLARDTLLDREVALKVPHPEYLEDPRMRERFYREGRAAARLRHPNICPVLDLGECGDVLYLTMPYLEGRPLSQCTVTGTREAARLVRGVALAMAEAHRHQVVHRDLKRDNVLITPDGEPVVTDFGVALLLDVQDPLTPPGLAVGTPRYMAPEQIEANREELGVACDVFALGVILYRLLTGRMPFAAPDRLDLALQILGEDPLPPSQLCPGLSPRLEVTCLKALAKRVEDRFASMTELADALGEYLEVPRADGGVPRPLVAPEAVRFAFVGMGERAPDWAGPQDHLWLDVGNDLRPGVIDHHHLTAGTGSTAGLVLAYPGFLDRSVEPARRADAAFTLVLHDKPDLDAVAAAYLALGYLCTRAFPAGAEALARYVDEVDDGVRGATQANPFDLYAAFQQLADRLLRRPGHTPHEVWQELVRDGMRLVGYAVEQANLRGISLTEVDAFACPGLFEPADRGEIASDLERYRRKLADPRTYARQVRLRLPGQFGGTVEVEALLVRDVQNIDDPERCVFFKDWARTDGARSPDGRGFAAVCVFCSEGPRQVRRAILSVTPDSKASLCGLGGLLDRAESGRRRQVFGVDDRVVDPATGAPKVPRPGYDNADPWYDGRAHGYTIVDSPRAGTLLTAEEIDRVFLEFGGLPHTWSGE